MNVIIAINEIRIVTLRYIQLLYCVSVLSVWIRMWTSVTTILNPTDDNCEQTQPWQAAVHCMLQLRVQGRIQEFAKGEAGLSPSFLSTPFPTLSSSSLSHVLLSSSPFLPFPLEVGPP